MCDHALHCEYCQDHRGEALMFKKLAKHRRMHCVTLNRDMDDKNTLICTQKEELQVKDQCIAALEERVCEKDARVAQLEKELRNARAAHKREMQTLRNRRQEDAEYVKSFEAQQRENAALKTRVKQLKQEKGHVEQAQCVLKQSVKEHKTTIALLQDKARRAEVSAFDAQVEALTVQVDKLRALNLHLSTTCVTKEKQLVKLECAHREVRHLVFELKQQCDIFCYVFKMASTDTSVKRKLIDIMESINVEPAKILRA